MRKSFAALAALLASQAPLWTAAAQGPAPEVVSVQLSNFKFSPSELMLHRGRTYRLHLINAAGGGHDFSAPGLFAASIIAAGDRRLIGGGKVKLAGRQTVDIVLTPQTAGVYKVTCTHFLHSGMGMNGHITVQ